LGVYRDPRNHEVTSSRGSRSKRQPWSIAEDALACNAGGSMFFNALNANIAQHRSIMQNLGSKAHPYRIRTISAEKRFGRSSQLALVPDLLLWWCAVVATGNS
jgi:hypothetical protein